MKTKDKAEDKRGLTEPARRSELPTNNKAVDARIAQARQEIKSIQIQIQKRQTEDPNDDTKDLISQLKVQVDKIHRLNMQRIRNLHYPLPRELKKSLNQSAYLMGIPWISEEGKVKKDAEIRKAVRLMYKKNIEIFLDRIRRNNDPVWHIQARKFTIDLQTLGIDELMTKDDKGRPVTVNNYLTSKWVEYQQALIAARRETQRKSKLEEEGGPPDPDTFRSPVKSTGKRFKSLDEIPIAKKKARGTHDRGTDGRLT